MLEKKLIRISRKHHILLSAENSTEMCCCNIVIAILSVSLFILIAVETMMENNTREFDDNKYKKEIKRKYFVVKIKETGKRKLKTNMLLQNVHYNSVFKRIQRNKNIDG